jgi:hypothetical protein
MILCCPAALRSLVRTHREARVMEQAPDVTAQVMGGFARVPLTPAGRCGRAA